MKPQTALIVDDERIARRELAYLLREHPEVEVVAEAASVEEAARAVDRFHPDLVFLDVQMPGESGFDLFTRTIVEAQVIFVTAYDEFAVRAFDVNALDYLTKPVRPERLRQTIERSSRRIGTEPPAARRLVLSDSVFLTIDRAPRFIKVGLIECILAEGDYTRIIAATGPVGLVLKPIKDWEHLLPPKHFCRIQRSTIINCEQVLRLEPTPSGGYDVYMKHLEAPLAMSRRCARQFRGRFEI